MKSIEDLQHWAATRYRRGHRRWIGGQAPSNSTTPGTEAASGLGATFTLGVPTEARADDNPDALAAWATSWRRWRPPAGARLEWVRRSWHSWGRQELPARVHVETPEAMASLAGRSADWRRCTAVADRLRSRWPESPTLPGALPGLVDAVAALEGPDVEKLLAVAGWLVDHPDSGLLPRQLPVPGVDTKWLERHRGLVQRIVAGICGEEGLGLSTEAQQFRVRVLDQSLTGADMSDFTAGVEELDRLRLAPAVVLIVENLTTAAALPALPGVVAVWGHGIAVVQLEQVGWIAGAPILYWGDLDTHGFRILSRARQRLPATRSVLMDAATLHSFAALAGHEPAQAHGVTGLTAAEAGVYRELEADDLRLEQERIPMDWAAARLREALRGPITPKTG